MSNDIAVLSWQLRTLIALLRLGRVDIQLEFKYYFYIKCYSIVRKYALSVLHNMISYSFRVWGTIETILVWLYNNVNTT
ncbi:MAG: hypothetical protein MI674_04250, partial [Cytophagales bacterium]|nr:hypothetical protein [Cytophagales bacterium]